MKKEIRNAIIKAIKESELNGYKWTITPNGLKWSYCDIAFTFEEHMETTGETTLFVYDEYDNANVFVWYGEDKYSDCKTLPEAYYIATKSVIRKANNIY